MMNPTAEDETLVNATDALPMRPGILPPEPPRHRPWGAYVAIALLALALGAAGMFVALRATGAIGRGSSSSAMGQADAVGGAMAGTASIPGMDMSGGATAARPTEATDKAVQITPERQQLIGVRTATVADQTLDTTIRTVGTLAYDETRTTQIHTKIAGWVNSLYVDYVGQLVRRGQPLFTIYSPDLVSTQQEYLLALKARRQLGDSQFAETRAGAASLVDAARDRLKLWDISDGQIADLERTGEPRKTLTLYSPFSGVVLERNAFAGQYVTPETSTFKIADLSTIWVLGQVFEYELPGIALGQDADIEFPYGQTTRALKGKVTFIYPDIDPQTRRARVRLEFRNPGLALKPDTYVTVILKTPAAHRLAIPKEAVIDDGTKQYAIVALPNGYFDPREIKVGPPSDQYYPVISGLQPGDRIVTSAQFLVDSETNLQAAMQAMSASMPGMGMGGGDTKGKDMKGGAKGGPAPAAPGKKDDLMQGMDMKGTDMSAPAAPTTSPKADESMKGMDMKGTDMSVPATPEGGPKPNASRKAKSQDPYRR